MSKIKVGVVSLKAFRYIIDVKENELMLADTTKLLSLKNKYNLIEDNSHNYVFGNQIVLRDTFNLVPVTSLDTPAGFAYDGKALPYKHSSGDKTIALIFAEVNNYQNGNLLIIAKSIFNYGELNLGNKTQVMLIRIPKDDELINNNFKLPVNVETLMEDDWLDLYSKYYTFVKGTYFDIKTNKTRLGEVDLFLIHPPKNMRDWVKLHNEDCLSYIDGCMLVNRDLCCNSSIKLEHSFNMAFSDTGVIAYRNTYLLNNRFIAIRNGKVVKYKTCINDNDTLADVAREFLEKRCYKDLKLPEHVAIKKIKKDTYLIDASKEILETPDDFVDTFVSSYNSVVRMVKIKFGRVYEYMFMYHPFSSNLLDEVEEKIRLKIKNDISAIRNEKLIEELDDNIKVKIEHSLKAGNCLHGTLEFVRNKLNIDIDANDKEKIENLSVTVGELKRIDDWNIKRVLAVVARENK